MAVNGAHAAEGQAALHLLSTRNQSFRLIGARSPAWLCPIVMSETFFRLGKPDVSAEDFKTEILAINLKSGCYHSLRASGAQVWRLLMDGHSVEASISWLASFYGIDVAILEPDIRAFVAELEAHHLILADSAPAVISTLPSDVSREPYSKPVMETYADLQDLLLLDPIHEVDATGWPQERPNSPSSRT